MGYSSATLGNLVGGGADYLAIGVLALLGLWMLLHEEEAEDERVNQLVSGQGLVLLALGISISLDELAIGFTIGPLHLFLWLHRARPRCRSRRPFGCARRLRPDSLIEIVASAVVVEGRLRLRRPLQLDLCRLAAAELAAALSLGVDLGP